MGLAEYEAIVVGTVISIETHKVMQDTATNNNYTQKSCRKVWPEQSVVLK